MASPTSFPLPKSADSARNRPSHAWAARGDSSCLKPVEPLPSTARGPESASCPSGTVGSTPLALKHTAHSPLTGTSRATVRASGRHPPRPRLPLFGCASHTNSRRGRAITPVNSPA
ncbi:unnamed protein product, partial [Ectocarpus sp. 8 AP-2014]